ncbi:hypothetical protein [Streptomyces tsukubensis]|uniref:hypothetical protein n=1 Tax=Streptomyces tsukubensis TaxID=83656 RepID=UPI00344C8809
MTGNPDLADRTVQQSLTWYYNAATEGLATVLDAEAGLREVLLRSHHETAVDRLETVFDAEAGLRGILLTQDAPRAPTAGERGHHTAVDLLRTLSPALRMSLRSIRSVQEASLALSHDLVGASRLIWYLGIDPVTARTIRGDLNRLHTALLVRDLATSIARDLGRAGRSVRDRTRDPVLVVNLALAAEAARRIVDGQARGAYEHGDFLDLAGLVDTLRLGRARADVLHPDLVRDIDLVHTRDLQTARAICLGDDIDFMQAQNVVVALRAVEAGRVVGLALGREPLVADAVVLQALLDDFTHTDLSQVDLSGVDLLGVHWSEHTTRWPPGVDVEDVKARSIRAHDPGVWVIWFGTVTIQDLVEP